MISLGTLLSGTLTGAGVGLLILFKENKHFKENLMIVSIIYFIGVLIGFLIDLIGRRLSNQKGVILWKSKKTGSIICLPAPSSSRFRNTRCLWGSR